MQNLQLSFFVSRTHACEQQQNSEIKIHFSFVTSIILRLLNNSSSMYTIDCLALATKQLMKKKTQNLIDDEHEAKFTPTLHCIGFPYQFSPVHQFDAL